MNKKVKKQYNLITAISMIVGIVIGSGIFFKADDVLIYTNGNVFLGVIVFCIAGCSIIFGSLTIAQFALRTSKPGGVISYVEEFCSPSLAGSLGWFHACVYYPTLVVVVSWVVGIYACVLWGIEGTLIVQCMIGFFFVVVLFIVNVYSKVIAGYLQVTATFVKLIPLFVIGILGVATGNPENITVTAINGASSSFSFMLAIVPIAFSFDGWIVSTSISHEMKDPQKTLPRALIISPIFIVLIYSLYLVGISALVGPQQIIALGDQHVYVAANQLLGSLGGKILLVFVIVSVLGTVNGLIMGIIRLPYFLAVRGVFPNDKKIGRLNEKFDVPMQSGIVSFVVICFWYVMHYFVMKDNLLHGRDISEISIVMNYLFYIILYLGVIKLYKTGIIKKRSIGFIIPVLAILGSLMIFIGSILKVVDHHITFNVESIIFLLSSLVMLVGAYYYCKKKTNDC